MMSALQRRLEFFRSPDEVRPCSIYFRYSIVESFAVINKGDAWRETESTLMDRLSGLPTTTMMPSQAISHVSRVLEYDGKHDDEGPVVASTPSLGEPRQLTLLIVVSADNYVKPFANFC